jgi:hypothetical protein
VRKGIPAMNRLTFSVPPNVEVVCFTAALCVLSASACSRQRRGPSNSIANCAMERKDAVSVPHDKILSFFVAHPPDTESM